MTLKIELLNVSAKAEKMAVETIIALIEIISPSELPKLP